MLPSLCGDRKSCTLISLHVCKFLNFGNLRRVLYCVFIFYMFKPIEGSLIKNVCLVLYTRITLNQSPAFSNLYGTPCIHEMQKYFAFFKFQNITLTESTLVLYIYTEKTVICYKSNNLNLRKLKLLGIKQFISPLYNNFVLIQKYITILNRYHEIPRTFT